MSSRTWTAAIALCHRHGGKQRDDETHTLGVRLPIYWGYAYPYTGGTLTHILGVRLIQFSLWSVVIPIIPLPHKRGKGDCPPLAPDGAAAPKQQESAPFGNHVCMFEWIAELIQSLDAVGFSDCQIRERGQGYKDEAEDVRLFRASLLDG